MSLIIPAIDIINGRCVRLSQGDYDRVSTYDADAADMARRFLDHGMTRIHVVDLDGAKSGAPQNLRTLERIASIAPDTVRVEWGGGVKSEQALTDSFNAGASHVIVGSVAARQPELFERWLAQFGGERIILGADLKDGKVAVNGWLEQAELTADDLLSRFLPHGLEQAICTDVSRDGTLSGPAWELYARLMEAFPRVKFTVSGGVASIDDILRAKQMQIHAVIVGKAIYEGRISLSELEKYV
jgi:phosphoribosylformimino-5-aminoimidazole carboxamide ribotide isomerase